jgi:transcriptional regulator with XRE-family HTH domain
MVSPDMNFKKEIGRRLAEARDDKRWSLADLSRETSGVLSPSRISNYEQGERLPGPREILILSKALGRDPAYLMCLEGGEMTPQERELLNSWRTLPESERMAYLRRINAVALMYRDPVADERLKGWEAPQQTADQDPPKGEPTKPPRSPKKR